MQLTYVTHALGEYRMCTTTSTKVVVAVVYDMMLTIGWSMVGYHTTTSRYYLVVLHVLVVKKLLCQIHFSMYAGTSSIELTYR